MTREITHMKAFTAALESMGKDPFSIGKIAPTPVLVDQYFNDSTGTGDEGESDARGPWNEGAEWEVVEVPELEQGVENLSGGDNIKSSASGKPAGQAKIAQARKGREWAKQKCEGQE